MRKHYVTFYSPGTLFMEQTTRPIEAWDPKLAIGVGADVVERYGAKPFAFSFSTRIERDPVPDDEGGTLKVEPKTVATSCRYFIGERGTWDLLRLSQMKETPESEILRSNMRCNDWPIVIESRRSYRVTQPFESHDVVIDEAGKVIRRGDDEDLMAERRQFALSLAAS